MKEKFIKWFKERYKGYELEDIENTDRTSDEILEDIAKECDGTIYNVLLLCYLSANLNINLKYKVDTMNNIY